VLAVGDIRFRAKCFRKLHELRQNGTSFVLVNHNPQAIIYVCDRAAYLAKGKLVTSGNTEMVIEKYEEDLFLNGIEKSSGMMFLPDEEFFEVVPGKHEIQVQMPYFCLKPGIYTVNVKIKTGSLYTFDAVNSFRFTVKSDGKMSQCMFYQPRSWQLVSNDF